MSASRKTICRTFLCVPYGTSEQKHNRAKPMSELPSALFLIADGNEFRFARFYNVCEEVPLGTPESPPIVSGVSDMHPSDCPNVEETRNPMQTFSRKKCTHFSPTNFHLYFHLKSHGVVFSYYYLSPKRSMLIAAIPFLSAKKNTRKRASSWKHRQKRV